MESISKITKSVRAMIKLERTDSMFLSACAIFGVAMLYIFYRGQLSTIGLSLGVVLLMIAILPKQIEVALVAGALAGLIAVHYSRVRERFESEDEKEESFGMQEDEEEQNKRNEGFFTKEDEEEPFQGYEGFATQEEEEEFQGGEEEESRPRGSKKKTPPPDNGSRAEFLTLGKKYKLPSESDDKDFHLDAGTTFMNAYKSLKPDQIAAMTKDTQDLMQTQKQLMSTLQTLKPLIQDGKEMMNMFQGYFGSGNPTA
jgi:hypothetical protein